MSQADFICTTLSYKVMTKADDILIDYASRELTSLISQDFKQQRINHLFNNLFITQINHKQKDKPFYEKLYMHKLRNNDTKL